MNNRFRLLSPVGIGAMILATVVGAFMGYSFAVSEQHDSTAQDVIVPTMLSNVPPSDPAR